MVADEQEFASGSDKEDEETISGDGDGAGSDVENTPVSETRAKDTTTFMWVIGISDSLSDPCFL